MHHLSLSLILTKIKGNQWKEKENNFIINKFVSVTSNLFS